MPEARAVLLHCGDAVYAREFFEREAAEVVKGLGETGLELTQRFMILDGAGSAEAAKSIDLKNVDLIIVHLISWHITPYVMAALKNAKDVPVLVWSIGGRTDGNGRLHSPAAPAGLTALLPVLSEMGYKCRAICQKPDEGYRFGEILRFARVAAAYGKVRNSRIGFVGYADMGLYSCAYDKMSVYKSLGIETEEYFSYEIGKLMESYTAEETERQSEEIKGKFLFENEVSQITLDKVSRLYLALKSKCDLNGLSAISIKCVTGVTKHMGVNPCMAQSLLAGGDVSVICECDAMGLITTMMLNALSGKTATFLEHYEFYDDSILIGTCGFLPYGLADGEPRARSANLGDFFVGLSNVSRMKPGLVTLARLYKKGDGYGMFLTKGEAHRPPKWIELGWKEPLPDFPSLLVKTEMPVTRYVENVPGQHIIVVYGDYTAEVRELCALMGIVVKGEAGNGME